MDKMRSSWKNEITIQKSVVRNAGRIFIFVTDLQILCLSRYVTMACEILRKCMGILLICANGITFDVYNPDI